MQATTQPTTHPPDTEELTTEDATLSRATSVTDFSQFSDEDVDHLDRDYEDILDDEIPDNYEYKSEYNSLQQFWKNFKSIFVTTNVKWRQHYYFYIHLCWITFVSFSLALFLYVTEHNPGGSKIPFIDALFNTVSLTVGCGLLSFDHSTFTFKGQAIILAGCAIGGICVTTIPALLILMFQAHKRMMEAREKVAKREMKQSNKLFQDLLEEQDLELVTHDDSHLAMRLNSVMQDVVQKKRKKTDVVPYTDVEFKALVWLLVLILSSVFALNIIACFIQLMVLTYAYTPEQLEGRSPLWISIFQTLTGFNNAGMSIYGDNLARFQLDYTIITVLMILLMLGNVLYPVFLRTLIVICYKFSKKNKRCFKYLLNKHHHVSIHLYPSLQTRIYLAITIALQVFGAFYGSYVESKNPMFAHNTYGEILFICYFHVVSARTAGFTSVDISRFSIPFVVYIIVMMRTKAQMACDLKGQAYGIVKTEKELKKDTKSMNTAFKEALRINQMKNDIQRLVQRRTGENEPTIVIENPQGELGINNAVVDLPHVNMAQKPKKRKKKKKIELEEIEEDAEYEVDVKTLPRKQQFFFFFNLFLKKMWYHTNNLIAKNNVWLVIVALLICMIEEPKMVEAPQNWSLLKVIFEVISAFGTCGYSLGYPGIVTSFSTVFTVWSKLLIIFVMICGKHRGFSGSMKDQEYAQFKNRLALELEFEKKKEQELKEYLKNRKKSKKIKI